jgi:hypothetical protein
MLPELRGGTNVETPLVKEYSSADNVMSKPELSELLRKHKLLVEDQPAFEDALVA